MDGKRTGAKIVVIAGAAGVAGIALGAAIGLNGLGLQQPAGAQELPAGISPNRNTVALPVVEPSPLATNDAGQVYGSLAGREGSKTKPDLVEAWGDNGAHGYVYWTDLRPYLESQVESPEDALAANAKANQEFTINLFSADGKTVIGTFTINKGAQTDSE